MAAKNGQYLDIFLAGKNSSSTALRGYSRCVHSDGRVIDAAVPSLKPFE
jgi:hypothetical protein